jgi:hypothetical protein
MDVPMPHTPHILAERDRLADGIPMWIGPVGATALRSHRDDCLASFGDLECARARFGGTNGRLGVIW